MTRERNPEATTTTVATPADPVAVTWEADPTAVESDPVYVNALTEWLQAHDLNPYKVTDVAVFADANGRRWVQAVTRTDDNRDTVRVVVPLRGAPPVPAMVAHRDPANPPTGPA